MKGGDRVSECSSMLLVFTGCRRARVSDAIAHSPLYFESNVFDVNVIPAFRLWAKEKHEHVACGCHNFHGERYFCVHPLS